MSVVISEQACTRVQHSWWRKIEVAFVAGPTSSLLSRIADNLMEQFRYLGHRVAGSPSDSTDVILTTARYGEPLSWREALLFQARRRFCLDRTPTLITLVHILPSVLHRLKERFQAALAKHVPDPQDYAFPGLAPTAYRVLHEQGQRGGPMLAIERLIQAQAKSIRSILIVGDQEPLEAYTFDLAGAHPRTPGDVAELFYEDLALRIVTTVSTHEVTEHKICGDPISYDIWCRLTTPRAMRRAAVELDRRRFFTEMVRIGDLVAVPAVEGAVSRQYSEGCFATWEPAVNGLIATITGSARPVDKGNITDDDLAVIVGVRSDGKGALVRHVEGKENIAPSSESVEMMMMDQALPTVRLGDPWTGVIAPILRSKLHGHRGVRAYDPKYVEYVPMAPAYHHYLVSCATEAQAIGIREAFSRSEALLDPADARQVVFTILPGHGMVAAEKWVAGKEPLQTIWEYMDAGYLEIEKTVPQGPFTYKPAEDGRQVIWD